jgi:hypothetical protein
MYISVAYRLMWVYKGWRLTEKEKIVIGQGMEGAIGEDGDSEKVGIN